MTSSQVPGAPERFSVASVRVFGASVGVAYAPDEPEIERRQEVGLEHVTQRDVLQALMELPTGFPVAIHALGERDRRRLRHAPHGVLDIDHDDVIRRAVAPLTPKFAVAAARSWREGLVKAGRFAPLCTRAMLLPTPPDDLDDALVQSSFYGIGICVFAGGELQSLLEPAPYVRRRHSSAQWWFAEEVYRQVPVVTGGESTPALRK